MASVQEVISSGDVEKIKQRRTACKRMLAVLNAQLDTKLVKTDNKFDHSEIERNKVLDDFSKVKRYYSEFEELHFAYFSFCLNWKMNRKKTKFWTFRQNIIMEFVL